MANRRALRALAPVTVFLLLAGCVPPAAPPGGGSAPSAAFAPPPPVDLSLPARQDGAPMVWRGPLGGASGSVTLRPVGGNDFTGVIGVGAPGCGGSVDGPVQRSGNRYVLVKQDPQFGICRVSMISRGRQLEVSEDNCLAWHGASCEFSGHATRVR